MVENSSRPNLKSLKADYQNIFAQMDDPYRYATARDSAIKRRLLESQERVKAFPSDKNEHESLIQLIMEGWALWEECENRLRILANINTSDRTTIATQINQSHENVEEYRGMFNEAIRNELSNTSSFYKAGESIQAAGQIMRGAGKKLQNAGNTMSSMGYHMTAGCMIPIIMLILLILLFTIMF